MTSRPRNLSQLLLCAVLLNACTGCVEFGTRRISVHRAFIVHWPPPKGTTELRLAVKDIIDMKGLVTSVGSAHFASIHQPAARDAKCLEEARRRGVRIVGKTNLTEFALGTSGLNEFFGTPKNNLNEEDRLIPGGSSSGSAVAVASGFADVAFGTDTGGSIRTPAACCGIYGLKTTHGLVPLDGVAPLSPRYLDTVGPMAKDLDHLVQGMDLLKPGFAAQYARARAAKPSARQIRIGRVKLAGTDPAIEAAVDAALAASGFRVIQLPETFSEKWTEAQKHGRTIAMADAWQNYGDHRDEKGVARATKTILLLGEVEYRLRYDDALKGRVEWQRTLRDVFRRVDVLAVPTMQKLPPKIPLFGRTALLEARVFDMQNTAAVNLAGNPAVAIPIPVQAEDAPVTSLQLVGPPLSEAALLNAARIIEQPPHP